MVKRQSSLYILFTFIIKQSSFYFLKCPCLLIFFYEQYHLRHIFHPLFLTMDFPGFPSIFINPYRKFYFPCLLYCICIVYSTFRLFRTLRLLFLTRFRLFRTLIFLSFTENF